MLRELRKNLKLSVADFSYKIGCGKDLIYSIESGKREISKKILVQCVNIFNINANWLLTGQGEMFLSDTSDSPPQKSDSDEKDRRIAELEAQLANSSTQIPAATNPVVENCAESASNLIRNMNKHYARKSLELVNEVFDEQEEANEEESNYTGKKRKTG